MTTSNPPKNSGCAIVVAILIGLYVLFLVAGVFRSEDTPMAPARDITPLKLTEHAKQVQRDMAEAARLAKPAQDLAKYTKFVDEAETRLNENEEKLKKYYATKAQMAKTFEDAVNVAIVVATYDKSKIKEERKLRDRAEAVFNRVSRQQRVLYASSIEQIFIDNGLDIDVDATGKNNDQLRLKYVLMSRPLVYKLQNQVKLDNQAKTYGFKKLVFSDGYDESWTVDLSSS